MLPSVPIKAPQEVLFEKQVAEAIVSVHKSFLLEAKLKAREYTAEYRAGQLILGLEKTLYAHPLGRLIVEYPASPWEHFRAVYFPRSRFGRWFIRRRPIRMHYEARSALASFPEAHYVWLKSFGRMVFLLK